MDATSTDTRELRRGDVVTLRSPTEILGTLDEHGTLDGLPFMPEMLGYFGREYVVTSRTERVCDAVSRARKITDAVFLDAARCDGAGHAGCQARCRIFWKERWLTRVGGDAGSDASDDPAYADLEALARANARLSDPEEGKELFSCQATRLLEASELIPYWDRGSLVREVTSRNVTPWRWLRVIAGIVVNEPRRRLRASYPFKKTGNRSAPSDLRGGLEIGTRVRVRTAAQVAETLDDRGRLRGLWFDREMVPYCGKVATVKAKVERFIDEKTGEMIELKSDCYILDGIVCKGDISDGRWFCRREIYPWWREAWLETEPEPKSSG